MFVRPCSVALPPPGTQAWVMLMLGMQRFSMDFGLICCLTRVLGSHSFPFFAYPPGESVLSLLIVVAPETSEYYETFFSGVISITLLEYLHFRSQPYDADDHAMVRNVIMRMMMMIILMMRMMLQLVLSLPISFVNSLLSSTRDLD
jgi:hypothetical protein